MIDTHCHIDLYPNPLQIANECERKGIVTIGMTNLPSHFELGFRHLTSHRKVRLALGMHPMYISNFEKELPIFKRNISNTSYVGEVGLDFSKEGLQTKDEQLIAFKEILACIRGKKKLLSLHSRKAEREVFQHLLQYNIKLAIFHWYSGPLTLIDEIAKAGFMFSVNPAMIKSVSGKSIIKNIPMTNILTESDGPFIEVKGRPVKPADVELVTYYLADQWCMSHSKVEELITGNFKKLISHLK